MEGGKEGGKEGDGRMLTAEGLPEAVITQGGECFGFKGQEIPSRGTRWIMR